MAKQGMKRPEVAKRHPRNEGYVPEIQGKAKSGKKKADPIIAGTMGAETRVWHEKPLSGPYDTDLANDNLLGDVPYADLQDL